MNSSLRAFAEDPNAFLPQPDGARVVDEREFFLAASGRRGRVCRLRTDDVERVFAEVTALAPEVAITWTFGAVEHEPALRSLGCHDPAPHLTAHITALATAAPPPAVDDVEVRRVESYDDFLAGLAVSEAGWGVPHAEDPQATWARRSARPGGQWLAYLDGRPVAYAGAIAGPRGLFLTGGVTVPSARGRGAYRALVRARWEEAVRRGTPALAVHAEAASRRVLERIGFERICPIVELVC
jgi:GNAT superfamily N-acetyltransferase